MEAVSNKAAWLHDVRQPLRVGTAKIARPGKNQILVKNHAVAINPIDWKIQQSGYSVQRWPFVPGLDTAGEVFEVGDGVTHFKRGDRIIAHLDPLNTPDPSSGAFQLYSIASVNQIAKIPDSISYQEACVVPLAFNTALVGLTGTGGKIGLGLPPPLLDPNPVDKCLIVWGSSSAVGGMATQIATAAGVKVVAVTSTANAEFARRCGAVEVLDYKSDSVIGDVVGAVHSMDSTFAGVFNAISTPDTYKLIFPIMERLGGGRMLHTIPLQENTPDYVEAIMVHGTNPTVTGPFWQDFVPLALETGKLQCLPPSLVVGEGLENAQKALDTSKSGMSARKVVLQL